MAESDAATPVALTAVRPMRKRRPSKPIRIRSSESRSIDLRNKFHVVWFFFMAGITPWLAKPYTVGRPLSHDVLFSFKSSGYQLGSTEAAVSAQRPVGHVNNALKNITTEWTPHSVETLVQH